MYQDVKRQRLEYQEQRQKEREQERAKETKIDKQSAEWWSEKMEKLSENSAITRLETKVQQLDERLAKLERYTQE